MEVLLHSHQLNRLVYLQLIIRPVNLLDCRLLSPVVGLLVSLVVSQLDSQVRCPLCTHPLNRVDLLVANQVLLPQANLRASQLFFQPRSRVAVPHRYHRRHRVVSRRGNLLVFPPANLQVDRQVNPSQRRQVSLLVVPHLSLLRNLPEALPRSPLVCRVDSLLRVLPRIRLLNPLEVQQDSPVEPQVASPRRSRSACLLRSRVAVLVLNPAVVHLVSPPDSQPPHHPRSRRVHQHASRLRALLVSRLRSLQAYRPPTDLPVNHLDRRLLSPVVVLLVSLVASQLDSQVRRPL